MSRVVNDGYEMVPVDSLTLHPANPRRGDVEAIGESLSVNGFYGALVVQRSTGYVLAGNHRLRAAAAAGLVEVPVIWADVDDATATRILLADNRSSDLAVNDDVTLLALLGNLRDDSGLLGTLYNDDSLAELLVSVRAHERHAPLTDPDAVPDVPVEPITKPGDLWLLGPHRLLCGDSRDPAVLGRVLDGALADMVWTDPPYGVDYGEKNRFLQTIGRADRQEDIEGDGRDPAALRLLLGAVFDNLVVWTRPGAVWFVAAPPGPQLGVFAAELLRVGVWRQLLCWAKNRPVFGRSDYHYAHETLFYGWTPGGAHRPPPDHALSSVWAFDTPSASKLHPTMKPVALVRQALDNHLRPGETVLDPFAGSGTTLIAAEGHGGMARCVESSPAYVDVIARRYEQHTGVVPVLEASGEPVSFVPQAAAST